MLVVLALLAAQPFADIVDYAQAAPAEFASRALLRVASAVTGEERKRELLERAFEYAAAAREPVRIRTIPQPDLVGTRALLIETAHNLALDRLSLQTEAVNAMLAVDPLRARAMFEAIPRPIPRTVGCKDTTYDDVSAYWNTLGQVASRAFTTAEQKKLEHVQFVAAAIGTVSSRWDLRPATTMVEELAFQHELITTALSGARERQDKGPSCKEGPDHERIFPGKATSPMQEKFRLLLFGTGSVGLTVAQRSTSEWKKEFADYLRDIEGMKPDPGESEASFYYKKAGAYSGALLAVPPGPERDKVVAQFIAYVTQSNFQQESPIEWFSQVENIAGMAQPKILDALERSGHPVLILYAKLERAFGARPSWAR